MDEHTKPINRVLHFELLRILGALGVILIHVSSILIDTNTKYVTYFNAMNFYNSIGRFAVPVFIMISGALLLDPQKQISLKEIFTKYIKRILIVLISWSLFYWFIYCLFRIKTISGNHIWEMLGKIWIEPAHLWYLYMLIGLYLITPICKIIAEKEKVLSYSILTWLLIGVIIPNLFFLPILQPYQVIIKRLNFGFINEYIGYFLLGYYLTKIKFKIDKYKIFLGLLILLSLFITIYGTRMLNPDNYFKTSLCGYSHLNVIIYSVCLYVFACFSWSRMQFSDKLTKIILNLGKASFGIYLSQEIFIKIIRHAGLATKYITPWISIPILSVLVFISSYCVVLILSKIPYLKETIS